MDLRTTQLKDTYGNLVTTGTTAGSPTTGGLQNGQGTLLTAVGIGTDSPQTILNGFSSSARGIAIENAYPIIAFSDTADASYKSYIGTDSSELYLWNAANGPIVFATNSTERMRIDSGGDISFRDGATNEAFYWDASTARLGIGTDSPSNTLSVFSSGASAITIIDVVGGSTGAGVLQLSAGTTLGSASFDVLQNSAGAFLNQRDNKPMSFYVNNDEKIRIEADGDIAFYDDANNQGLFWDASAGSLGIGETNPTATLNIKSASSSNSDNLAQVLTNSEFRLQYRSDDLSSLYIGGLGSTRGYLQGVNSAQDAGADISLNPYGGNVGIGTNTPTSISGYTGATLDNSTNGGFIDLQSNGATAFRFLTNGSVNNIETRTATPIVFLTNTTERMRIDSSGNVGIGETHPSTKLQVTDGYISTYHNINANTAGYGVQFFTNAGGSKNTIATIQPEQVGTTRSGNLLFSTSDNGAPTERMRIDPSGNVSITTGNLILDSGAGIDFSDTPNSSGTMTSELLDDYEEGTWTPVLRGASTAGTYEFATSNAHYTKVGRVVHVTANLVLASSITGGGTAYAKITGLPYAKGADMAPQGSVLFRGVDFADDAAYVTMEFVTNGTSSELYFPAIRDNASATDTDISAFGANDTINFSITYFV